MKIYSKFLDGQKVMPLEERHISSKKAAEYAAAQLKNVKASVINNFMQELFLRIRDEIILNAYEFQLPHHLGSIFMSKKKLKYQIDSETGLRKLPLDKKATFDPKRNLPEGVKPMDRPIYHTNDHTNGWSAKITWLRVHGPSDGKKSKFVRHKIYEFKPVQSFQRMVRSSILENPRIIDNYVEVGPGNQ